MSLPLPIDPNDEPECERCHGYGYYVDGAGVAHRCDCRRDDPQAAERAWLGAGIPRKFLRKDFKSFEVARQDTLRRDIVKNALAYAKGFHRGEEQGLLFRGAPGSGKTHIAVATLKVVIERGFTGHYANFTNLLSLLRSSYDTASDLRESVLLEAVDHADLLVLDDVGAESVTDWTRDRLYLIINRRYENARPVLLTTNCDEADLEARVGARTASRLYEMSAGQFPQFPRQDWRRAKLH